MDSERIKLFRKKLRQLERDVFWELKRDSDCFGVTLAQCHTLLEIGSKGNTSLVELASELGIDPSTLSRTINGMVNNGLVNRKLNPSDRRYVSITLTKKGKSLFDSIENFYNSYISRLFEFIPKGKHKQVMESFILFSGALRKCKETNTCFSSGNKVR